MIFPLWYQGNTRQKSETVVDTPWKRTMLSCSTCFINTTSLQNRCDIRQTRNEAPSSLEIVRDTYAFRPVCLMIISTIALARTSPEVRDPNDFQRHLLTFVRAFPNLGHPRDALCTGSLFHNALEFVRRRDNTMKTTQPPKFNDRLPFRFCSPVCEVLEIQSKQEREVEPPYLGELINGLYRVSDAQQM